MLTAKQLTEAVKVVKADLSVLGIEVPNDVEYSVSKRLTRGLANYSEYYRRDYSMVNRKKYIITRRLIKVSVDVPSESVQNMLMHEMIHAVNYYEYHENGSVGTKPHHGRKFIRLANIVNKAYPGKYYVTKVADEETSYATLVAKAARRRKPKPSSMGFANFVIIPMPTLENEK